MGQHQAGDVGTEAEEAKVGERDVAGEPSDDVPAHRHRGVGEGEVEEVEVEAVDAAEGQAYQDCKQQHRPSEREEPAPAQRLSLATWPKKPWGRTMRTAK